MIGQYVAEIQQFENVHLFACMHLADAFIQSDLHSVYKFFHQYEDAK